MSLSHHWTLTLFTDHPLRLHLPSFTAPSQLFHIISLHLFTIFQSLTHYLNPDHSATLCRVLLAQSPYKAFSLVSLVCLPVFRFCPCPWIILSAEPSGLSLPIADPRLPKDYSSVLSMPYPFAPARPCLYWPCSTIKSLHLDPNVSRLVILVTECFC